MKKFISEVNEIDIRTGTLEGLGNYINIILLKANIDQTKLIGLTATPGRGSDQLQTRELVEFFDSNKNQFCVEHQQFFS